MSNDSKSLVSIIIPVFNAALYVDDTINSILQQSYENIEIILIDDGSTDDSYAICSKHAESDKRVVLIKQENSGVSTARNNGMDIALGEYISFVDADDILLPSSIENMVRIIEESQVDAVRTSLYFEKCGVRRKERIGVAEGLYSGARLSEIVEGVVLGKVTGYVWLLMIRKNALSVRFDATIRMMEDSCFYIDLLLQIKSIYISELPTYVYKLNSTSASRALEKYERNISDLLIVDKRFRSLLEEPMPSLMPKMSASHAISIITQISLAVEYPEREYKLAMSRIKALRTNLQFQQLITSADLTGLGMYKKALIKFGKKGSRLPLILLFYIRSTIRRFK